MPAVMSYFDDWKDLISRGIRSYREVSAGLDRAREDHRRSAGYVDDSNMYGPGGYSFEIPLLWFSF